MGRRRSLGLTKSVLLVQFDILYRAMCEWGADDSLADSARRWASGIAFCYVDMNTSFNHILLDCPKPKGQCADPDSRIKNIRKCHSSVKRLNRQMNQTTDSVLEMVTNVVDDIDGIVDAANRSASLQEFARREGYPAGNIARKVATEFSLVLNEYTSRYPLDFVLLITEEGRELNEASAHYFGVTLFNRMVELNAELKGIVDKSRSRGEMPSLIDYMRRGMMVVPSPQEIEEIVSYVQQISTSKGSSRTYVFLDEVSNLRTGRDLVSRIVHNVGRDENGWLSAQQLLDLSDTEYVARRLAMAGQYSTAIQALRNAKVDAGKVLEVMELLGTWNDEPARRVADAIVANAHRSHVLHSLVEHRDILFSGDGSAAEVLLRAKSAPTKMREYVSLCDEPAKQEAYLHYVRDKPKKKTGRFLATLARYSDLRVGQALKEGTVPDDLESALQSQDSMTGPVFYDHPLYAEVTRHNVWDIINMTPDPNEAMAYLASLPSNRLRGCLLRNRPLLTGILDDLSQGGIVASQLQQAHGLREGVYRHIMSLFSKPEEETIMQYEVDKLIFVGDRLRPDALNSIGERLDAKVVHVSQDMSLKRFRDILSHSRGHVVVAYYVEQCGHSHSGPVKWMTERSEGKWVDLHEVDEERIYQRLLDRLAS